MIFIPRLDEGPSEVQLADRPDASIMHAEVQIDDTQS
jgi:hypothetical protein